MIEFKSPCGHTVRARDEDAGRPVKCSYCGTEVRVPSAGPDDLSYLLDDESSSTDLRRAEVSVSPFRRRRYSGLNVRDILLKLTYSAAAITVLVVVGRSYILPLVHEWRSPPPAPPSLPAPPAKPARTLGLASGLEGSGGLYVLAVPESAEVRIIEAKSCPAGKRLLDMGGCRKGSSGASFTNIEGDYVVETAVVWNDQALKNIPGYNTGFRRQLEAAAGDAERTALMRSFFLADGQSDVFVVQMRDQWYLLRQYRVSVQKDTWESVTSLFVPADLPIEQVVARHLPSEERFRFDRDYVSSELEYYNVPPLTRPVLMDALTRVGAYPLATKEDAGGRASQVVRLFKIDVATGQFRIRQLGQSSVPGQ